jgi:hypothetical protein
LIPHKIQISYAAKNFAACLNSRGHCKIIWHIEAVLMWLKFSGAKLTHLSVKISYRKLLSKFLFNLKISKYLGDILENICQNYGAGLFTLHHALQLHCVCITATLWLHSWIAAKFWSIDLLENINIPCVFSRFFLSLTK